MSFLVLFRSDLRKERNNNMQRFKISTIIENGYPHYKIYDCKNGRTVHCDINELNETLVELMERKDQYVGRKT